MSTWIKMCGTTNLADAEMCVAAGVDALGFIFAESPREITPTKAGEISRVVPPHIERIGVFVNESEEKALDTGREPPPTGVQLHGEESPAYVQQLLRMAGEFPPRIIKTIPAN